MRIHLRGKRNKNWITRLLVFDILLLALLNPFFFPKILRLFTSSLVLPDWYPPFFWSLISLIFCIVLLVVILTKPRKTKTPSIDVTERSPIKGLRPFEFEDAEIFAKLQRETILKECLETIIYSDFRFGILTGESGCGKTSFLQAGLKPNLLKANHNCVYVKFTALNPLDSIRQATIEQVHLLKEPRQLDTKTSGEKVRLEQRYAELQQEYDTLSEKITRLRKDRIIETKTAEKFELEKQIEQAERERDTIMQELKELEHQLKVAQPSRSEIAQSLLLSAEDMTNADFITLLDVAVKNANGKPVVFLFDQFEQFFAHHKSKEDRKPFVQAMADWFQQYPKTDVKILISIRGDFSYRLSEFQKAMEYALGPQQLFPLEKFTSEEATEIFRVIAESEHLVSDRKFVQEMTEEELAGREDGLVSPVDVQILAWMIKGQKSDEERAFTRKAYEKLGGIEGLLERFLKRALDALLTDEDRQLAIKVLLALIDLERNVRAGVLTLDDLQNKLQGTVNTQAIQAMVNWLATPNVRLITPTRQDDKRMGYELAHERLIPALRKFADKELSLAAKANQLLDRRVNEWIRNNYNSRYLLNWRELRLIKKQKAYLIYGKQKRHKEKLITRSSRRFVFRVAQIVVTIVLVASFLGWWYSPQRQIWQIKEELIELSKKIRNEDTLSEIAIAFVKCEDLKQARLIAETIDASYTKAKTLGNIAYMFVQLGKSEKAFQVIETMEHSSFKAAVLEEIAQSFVDAGEFDKAMHVDENLADSEDRIYILRGFAEAFVEIDELERVFQVTEKILQVAGETEYSYDIFSALTYLIDVFIDIGETEKALQIAKKFLKIIEEKNYSHEIIRDLRYFADDFVEIGETDTVLQIAETALQIAEKMPSSEYRMDDLRDIIVLFMNVDKTERAKLVAEKAFYINENAFKSWWLKPRRPERPRQGVYYLYYRDIIHFFSKIGEREKALQLIEKAIQVADQIEDAKQKASALRDIVEKLIEIGEVDRALQVAGTIEDAEQKASALRDIVEKPMEIGEVDRALQVAGTIEDAKQNALALGNIAKKLVEIGKADRALQIAGTIKDAVRKGSALQVIVEKLMEIRETDRALQVAGTIENSYQKAWVLRGIVRMLTRIEEADRALQVAGTIEDAKEKASALGNIAKKLVEIGEADRALQVAGTIEDASWKAFTLGDIAKKLVEIGEVDRALQVAGTIEDAPWKASALGDVIEKLMEIRETDRALQVAGTIEDDEQKASALRDIVEKLMEIRETDRALQVAGTIEDQKQKAYALRDIVKRLMKIHESEKVLQMSEEIFQITQSIEESSLKTSLLLNIGKKLHEQAFETEGLGLESEEPGGDLVEGIESEEMPLEKEISDDYTEKVRWFVEEAFQVAKTIENPGQRKISFKLTEQSLRNLRDKGIPDEILGYLKPLENHEVTGQNEFLDVVEKQIGLNRTVEYDDLILEHAQKNDVLGDIAATFIRIGETSKALQAAEQIEDADNKMNSLIDIIEKFLETGETQEALQIAERASQFTETTGLSAVSSGTLKRFSCMFVELDEIEKALQIAETIKNYDDKDKALILITQAYVNIENWQKACQVATDRIFNGEQKAKAFVAILSAWAEKKNPKLKEVGLLRPRRPERPRF